MSQFPEYGVPESKVSDNLIIGAVRNALGESEEVDTSDIVVDAADGIIRLTGVVSTFYEKRKAGRLARAAEGVKGVDNSLVVVPDKQPTDQKIFDAIDKALGNFPEGRPARIGVRMVESGVAYISGKASNAQEAWNAIDIASKIPGVKDIVDEIDIAPGEPIDDVEIKNLVIDALSEDSRVDPFEIEVNVRNAEVYLEGEVEDEEAIRAAGELASTAAGVKRVINHIRIR